MPRGFDYDEHVSLMRIVNPETGATITGEIGDQDLVLAARWSLGSRSY